MRYGWPGVHQSKRSQVTDVVVPRKRGSICVIKHLPVMARLTIMDRSIGHISPQSSPTHPKESLSPTTELFSSGIYRRHRQYKPLTNFVRILSLNESVYRDALPMAYRSFRNFLDALEQAGELKRVALPVDTDLLIAEWADREMKSPGGGKALLFEQPVVDGKRSEFPVAINTMGSRSRMALALQV